MGPRTYDLNLRIIESSWCSTTIRPLLEISPLAGTCLQNPCTSCAPFSKLSFANSQRRRISSSSCVTIGTSSLASLRVVHVLPKSWAQLVICRSPFERGWTQLRSVLNCCNKIWLTPSGPPNLVHPSPDNSLGIIGSLSSPSWFTHRFGGGRKCSSWASTPFTSIRLVKTCLWTLGLDPKLSFGRPWCLKTCVKNNLPVS